MAGKTKESCKGDGLSLKKIDVSGHKRSIKAETE